MSVKCHTWLPPKLVCLTKRECSYCKGVLLPTLQDSFSCKCGYRIHKKCLMHGKAIQPCTNVDVRDIQDILKSGYLELVVHLPKLQRKRSGVANLLSQSKNKYFIFTASGVLYYCKDNVVSYTVSSIFK